MAVVRLSEVLAAIVRDLIEAEHRAAEASIRFIREVGFRDGGSGASDDDWGEIRFIQFSFDAYDVPQGTPVVRTIRVPLLSLIPIPLQQIDAAEYEFAFKVDTTQGSEKALVDIVGNIAPYAADLLGASREPVMRVKVIARQSDLPAGLSSTLNRVETMSGEMPRDK